MLNLFIPLVLAIAIRVIMYAILLFCLLLVLRTIIVIWSWINKKREFPILTTLKIRTIIVIPVGISIIASILILGIISVSARLEITSLIKNLKSCNAIAVENSLMRDEGTVVENSIIQDKRKIIDLVWLLTEVEYKRSIYRGPAETREWVDIYIVGRNIKKPNSFRLIADRLLIGNFPEFTEYVSSDEYIYSSVRQVLGISDIVYSDADLNKQKFEIPMGEGKVWIGTKKEWESRPKKDKKR